MKLSKSIKVLGIALAVAVLASPTAYANIALTGAGATFPGPIIEACKAGYNKETGNTFTYGLGGSGAGRTASDKQTGIVNFSDTPHLAAREGVIHLPVVAGPIAVMYNIGNSKPLYLSPATVAGIFGGTITRWNDPAIVADNNRSTTKVIYKLDKNGNPAKDAKGNPVVLRTQVVQQHYTLPDKPIKVVYRSDSSGTSENFTRFLKGANAVKNPTAWPKAQNTTFTNAMPVDVASRFNFQGESGSAKVASGVAGKVGAITYSELSFATDNKLKVAYVQNAAGEFVAPDSAGTSAFLGGGTIKDNGTVDVDFVKSIKGAYPIGTASYALAYASGKDAEKQKIVAEWHTYLLDKCATKFPELGYIQITGALYDKAKSQIAKIK